MIFDKYTSFLSFCLNIKIAQLIFDIYTSFSTFYLNIKTA